MAKDDSRATEVDTTDAEEATVVVEHRDESASESSERSERAERSGSLWSSGSAGSAKNVRAEVEAALEGVSHAQPAGGSPSIKERAAAKASGAKSRATAAKDLATEKAAGAKDRAAGTDMKELAAHTTSLIDTARPFFLAAFAVVFTVLGFVEGDSGTAQWFVAGAIIFILAAGFSDELGKLAPRHRSDDGED